MRQATMLTPKDDATTQPDEFDIHDILLGMKYASLAITDDKKASLKKVGKMNPWQIEALALITGSLEEAHKPLSHILREHMNGLEIDCHINNVGMTPGMHFLDTQGYIAHNDDTIVLAYRSSTSVFDWLTNFSTTSSAWEMDEDIAQGFSGHCSGLEGLCCLGGSDYKPRVHTGFYNNFLATVPDIQTFLEPLLAKDQSPRKLYICGHSLGAGIATMTACYFLLEHDWAQLPHQLVVVTAGSPRACQNSMREHVHNKITKLREQGYSKKVTMCRVVNGKDIVPTLPPAMLGYRHIDTLIFISKTGKMQLIAKAEERKSHEDEVSAVLQGTPTMCTSWPDHGQEQPEERTAYDKKVQKIPKPLRDHMPHFYLKPMMQHASKLKASETARDAHVEVEARKKTGAASTLWSLWGAASSAPTRGNRVILIVRVIKNTERRADTSECYITRATAVGSCLERPQVHIRCFKKAAGLSITMLEECLLAMRMHSEKFVSICYIDCKENSVLGSLSL